MTSRRISYAIIILSLIALLTPPAWAADVTKKWRIGLMAGGFNGYDEINSDAANVLVLRDRDFELSAFYQQPTDQSAVFGKLKVEAGALATVNAQFAPSKLLIIEGSVGYQLNDLGDVEVQAEFDGAQPPIQEIPYAFTPFRVPVGQLEMVPVQVTLLARLRPRAKFNPYFGGGIGYTFIGFQPDSAFDSLSYNMDNSKGGLTPLSSSFPGGNAPFGPPLVTEDLGPARVEVDDTWEYHLVAGAEYAVKRKWSLIFDLRWIDASRSFEVILNDSYYLGVPVPNLTTFDDTPEGSQVYGPVRVVQGGLIDGGQLSLVPDTMNGVSESVNCQDPGTPSDACIVSFISNDQCSARPDCNPDFQVDPGAYYVQGGKIDLDGLALQIGFRYTFK